MTDSFSSVHNFGEKGVAHFLPREDETSGGGAAGLDGELGSDDRRAAAQAQHVAAADEGEREQLALRRMVGDEAGERGPDRVLVDGAPTRGENPVASREF